MTVDYLLTDSVNPAGNISMNLWLQLMDGRTEQEQQMAVNVIKAMFNSLDTTEKNGK